jgi:hypothetical protein
VTEEVVGEGERWCAASLQRRECRREKEGALGGSPVEGGAGEVEGSGSWAQMERGRGRPAATVGTSLVR